MRNIQQSKYSIKLLLAIYSYLNFPLNCVTEGVLCGDNKNKEEINKKKEQDILMQFRYMSIHVYMESGGKKERCLKFLWV